MGKFVWLVLMIAMSTCLSASAQPTDGYLRSIFVMEREAIHNQYELANGEILVVRYKNGKIFLSIRDTGSAHEETALQRYFNNLGGWVTADRAYTPLPPIQQMPSSYWQSCPCRCHRVGGDRILLNSNATSESNPSVKPTDVIINTGNGKTLNQNTP